MSWRTTLAGVPAGLAFLFSAFSQPGPWTIGRIALAVGGALLTTFAVFARDHAAPVPLPCEPAERVFLARAKDAPGDGKAPS